MGVRVTLYHIHRNRPSSIPIPTLTNATTSYYAAPSHSSIPHTMHAIKTPSFFRPSSRPASPVPSPPPTAAKLEIASNPYERHRPLSKLALASFRRPSPSPATVTAAATPLIQDGSYLEVLSLKLSEAVTRALAQPTGPALPHEQLGGRRPIPAGRGHALGAFISG